MLSIDFLQDDWDPSIPTRTNCTGSLGCHRDAELPSRRFASRKHSTPSANWLSQTGCNSLSQAWDAQHRETLTSQFGCRPGWHSVHFVQDCCRTALRAPSSGGGFTACKTAVVLLSERRALVAVLQRARLLSYCSQSAELWWRFYSVQDCCRTALRAPSSGSGFTACKTAVVLRRALVVLVSQA
eukprot:366574-Chlamydomonas_euryale.AAC.14